MNKNTVSHNSVMLIEDNPIDNFISEKIIRSNNFAENVNVYTEAESALKYLSFAALNSPSSLPAFIFLDISLPRIDGFEFLDALKELPPQINSIKIVILSGSVNPAHLDKSKTYKQVVGFFDKPLSAETLEILNKKKD